MTKRKWSFIKTDSAKSKLLWDDNTQQLEEKQTSKANNEHPQEMFYEALQW